MADQEGPDALTEGFAKLRSDMDDLLRKHEARLRSSMRGSPNGILRENTDTSKGKDTVFTSEGDLQGPQAPKPAAKMAQGDTEFDVNTPDDVIIDDNPDGGRPETPAYRTQLSAHTPGGEHWSRHLIASHSSWTGMAKLKSAWRRLYTCHHAMVARLPVLVSKDARIRTWVKKNHTYEFLRTLVLVLDALVVIFELSYASTKAKDMSYQGGIPDKVYYMLLTDFCCFMMLSDLLFHWILEFPHVDFIYGRTNRRWFNVIVVCEQILQVISQHAQPGGRSLSNFRIVVSQLSVVRVIRAFAEIPDVAFRMEFGIQEFRIMMNSLMNSISPFVMCAGPFMLILVTLAVFLEEGALAYLVSNDTLSTSHQDIALNFGTLDVTVLSLYKALFGGMDWADLYEVLVPLPWYLRQIFLLAIGFNFIAVFNIVAAVFIKVAFNRSESDIELLVQKEIRSRTTYLTTMEKLFGKLDDGDSKIYLDELEEHLQRPDIAAYFSVLGLDVKDAAKIARLLDEDGSNDVSREEFIFGCMRLTGDAKTLDLAVLQREVHVMKKRVADMHRFLRRTSGLEQGQTTMLRVVSDK